MKILFPALLLSLIACSAPSAKPTTTAVGRKVLFQPVPGPVPTPADGKPGIFKATVKFEIDNSGVVTKVIPESGVEPFLSNTINYAKKWRFSPNFPTPPGSPLSLTITYTYGSLKLIEIVTNLNPRA